MRSGPNSSPPATSGHRETLRRFSGEIRPRLALLLLATLVDSLAGSALELPVGSPLRASVLLAQEAAGPDMDSLLPKQPGFSRESLEIMLDEARALVGKQRYTEAITAMKLYLEKAPEDDQARLELARVYSWAEQYEPSLLLYQHLLATLPDDAEMNLEYAKVLLWAGKYSEAATRLETVRVKLHPAVASDLPPLGEDVELSPALASTGPDYLLERLDRALADAYAWSGLLDKSLPLYERLWRLHTEDKTLGLAYARALSQRRLYTQAIDIYQQLLEQGMQDPSFLLEQGRVLLWGERYAEGLKVLTNLRSTLKAQLEANDAHPGNHAHPGKNGATGKDAAAARMSSITPEFLQELNRTIAAGYAWSKDFTRAAQEYGSLVVDFPNDADLRLELARVLRELNYLDASLAQYDKYLEMRPGDLTVGLERAHATLWAQRYPDAIKSFQRLLDRLNDPALSSEITDAERNRYSDEVQRALTRAYMWSGHTYDALPHLMALVRKNPEDAALALEMARALAQSGHLDEARDIYSRYRALGGNPANATLGEGQTFQWEGDLLRARDAYQRAIAEDNTNAEAREALKQLEPMLGTPVGGSLRVRGDSEGFAWWTLRGFGEEAWQLYWLGADLNLDIFHQSVSAEVAATGLEPTTFVRLTPQVHARYRHNRQLSGRVDLGLQSTFTGIQPVGLYFSAEGRYAPEPASLVEFKLSTGDAVDFLATSGSVAQRFRQLDLTTNLTMSLVSGWQVWGQLKAVGLTAPTEACGSAENCGNTALQLQGSMDWPETLQAPIKTDLRFGGSLGILHFGHPDPDYTYWSPALYTTAALRVGAATRLPKDLSVDARLRVGLAYASDVATFFPELSGDLTLGQVLTDRIAWRLEAGYGRTARQFTQFSGQTSTEDTPEYWNGRLMLQGQYRF